MPRIITPEQFREAMPGYVDLAQDASTRILDRAIADPASGIEVQATIFNVDAPNYEQRVSDPEQVAELWEDRKRLRSIEADAPFDGGRIAIDYAPQGFIRHLRVWAYRVPDPGATPGNVTEEAREASHIPIGEHQKPDWINSGARAYLGNLIMPGHIFASGNAASGIKPDMYAYVYKQSDAASGKTKFYGASGVGNIFPDDYKNAIAPRYTQADAQLLEGCNVETYHAAKIGMLLTILGKIAQQGAL